MIHIINFYGYTLEYNLQIWKERKMIGNNYQNINISIYLLIIKIHL